MKSFQNFNVNQPTEATPPKPEVRREKSNEFSDWLDTELEALERQFDEFVTKSSTVKSFGR